MHKLYKSLLACRRGATAVEYGLIAGLIAVALVSGIGTLTTDLKTALSNVGTAISSGSTAPAA
jgi:pilus assembly protein Flp/PilA